MAETLETGPSLLVDTKVQHEIVAEHHSFFELNDLLDTDKLMLWSAYKAYSYICGIIIKLSKRAGRQRTQQIDEVTLQIAQLEKILRATELLELRQKVHALLLHKFECNFKVSKVNFYALSNRSGALLAKQVKAPCSKAKILSVHHLTSKQLLLTHKKLLMHLAITMHPCTTPSTHQTNLLSISEAKLQSISQPFTTDEILRAINALPLYKSPGEDGFTNAFYKKMLIF